MQPYMFTTLGWDNIDHIEDTLSGRDTSHRGIGIAIQTCFIAGNKTGPPNTIAMEPQNAFAAFDAEWKTNWAFCRQHQHGIITTISKTLELRYIVRV